MAFYIPILLVVLSNIVYHVLAKEAPSNTNAFATLVVTYLTAAATSFLLLLVEQKGDSLGSAFAHLNWVAFALGIAIVGLEFGYLKAYAVGWDISVGSLFANIFLAVALAFIGILFYKEQLAPKQIFGICLCLVGIFFLNQK